MLFYAHLSRNTFEIWMCLLDMCGSKLRSVCQMSEILQAATGSSASSVSHCSWSDMQIWCVCESCVCHAYRGKYFDLNKRNRRLERKWEWTAYTAVQENLARIMSWALDVKMISSRVFISLLWPHIISGTIETQRQIYRQSYFKCR